MKSRYIILVIVLIIIVGAIIYLQRTSISTPLDNGMATGTITETVDVFEVGKPAPDFFLLDFEGNEHSLEDYRGKYVLLNLWASWCPFCIDEMPLFQEFYDKYKDDGFEIVAINRAESQETAQTYAENLNLTFPLLLNPTDDVAKEYQLRAMPSSYFIDKEGNLLEIKHGAITKEMLEVKLLEHFGFYEGEVIEEEPEEEMKDPVPVKERSEEEMEEEMTEPVPVKERLLKEMMEEVVFETPKLLSTREIMETDGKKHSVPLEDIRGGGPSKDGIPSIDNPEFVSVGEANSYLDDEGLGISVMFGGIDRFYPFQIIVWHEIVNDIVGSQPVLITYCPLCGTGIAYDPTINGNRVEFGTSGKLWNSNLVMYDRQTDSYWSQVLGEAIVGELTGTELRVLPHDVQIYKDWKSQNPNGEVLSNKTGYSRDYTGSPYGDYSTNNEIYFSVDKENNKYHPKEPTFTVELNGFQKIYAVSELIKADSPFNDKVGEVELEISYNDDNTIKIKRLDTMETIIPSYGFWFSVVAVYPDAEVYTYNQ